MSNIYEFEFFATGFAYNKKGFMSRSFVRYEDITNIRVRHSSLRFGLTQHHLYVNCRNGNEIHLQEEADVSFDDIYYKLENNWLAYLKNPYKSFEEVINKKFEEFFSKIDLNPGPEFEEAKKRQEQLGLLSKN